MKEKLKVTPENLTTNFLSNISFFKRYNQNLFGISGTLGTPSNQESLFKTYNVDIGIIPPFKNRRFERYTSILYHGNQSNINPVIDEI